MYVAFPEKLLKTTATIGAIFSLKFTKTVPVWRPGSARTRWGSLSAPLDPRGGRAAVRGQGLLLKGGEGKGRKGEEREGMGRKGREGEGGRGWKERG